MAVLLSPEWMTTTHRRLAAMPHHELDLNAHIVIEFLDVPSGLPHAITVTASPDGASVREGDDLRAETVLTVSYPDAVAIMEGRVSSMAALRDGYVKVRGDVGVLVTLAPWFHIVLDDPEQTNPTA